MELKYITREMSTPRGKPKVFFTCHGSDFSRAFPIISADLLDAANCAVWYRDPAENGSETEERDELLSLLDEMQLIVIAVTEKFLADPDFSLERILPYALEKHIPVLPILLDDDLFLSFNRQCASLQAVEKYNTDPTVTPYEEVLEQYLRSVLVSDSMAEKVRNCFDAYVFLSYRKKDRKYAQRLMHLIHENDLFRDIAIWYDEFLIPGERFDTAIEDAFNKSGIFALTVTRNLLEAGNYVREVEYPMANSRKKEKKDMEIVPVEMYDEIKEAQRVDPDKLNEVYENLPHLQDEHKKPELDHAFIEALSRISKKETDGTPEHLFFIGLAYLYGIDVEVDRRKGLQLIVSAAESTPPCTDAVEKLVDMYLTGDSVEPSSAEAIRWQKKLIEEYRKLQDRSAGGENTGASVRLLKALLKLSDMEKDSGSPANAVDSAETALTFIEQVSAEVGTREMKRDMAVVLSRLGLLYKAGGERKKAISFLTRADRLYEELAEDAETERTAKDLALSRERLGDLCKDSGNDAAAEEAYLKVYEIRKRLVEKKDSSRNRLMYSLILTKLGNIEKSLKRPDKAEAFYHQALETDRVLAGELRTPQARDNYAVSCIKLGDLEKSRKAYEAAADWYSKAESALKEALNGSDSFGIANHYAGVIEKSGSIAKHRGQTEKADELLGQAVTLREELRERKDTVQTNHELAAACYNWGLFSGNNEMIRRAHEIWEVLAKKDPHYQKYADMAFRSGHTG